MGVEGYPRLRCSNLARRSQENKKLGAGAQKQCFGMFLHEKITHGTSWAMWSLGLRGKGNLFCTALTNDL